MECCGRHYSVVHHEGMKYNSFWLYEHTVTWDEEGRPNYHRRLVVKYDNMASCLYYLSMDKAFYQV